MGELISHRHKQHVTLVTRRSQAYNDYHIWSNYCPLLLTAGQLLTVRFIYFCTVSSIHMYAVGLIFVRFDWYMCKFDLFVRLDWYMCNFDLYVCGSIYFCTVGLIFVEVRFICMRFDLFFAVLILNERDSLYLCAFNIGWTRFEDFVRNGTP